MYEITEFKNHPIIVLKKTEDDKYPFSFGIRKATLILENFDAIKKFVEDNKTK